MGPAPHTFLRRKVKNVATSLKKQAAVLSLANGYTRALGFGLRLILARLMDPQALGLMEMASSVSMLALTPVTAGTPMAMSRLTAKRPACDQPQVLWAGLSLVHRMSLVLIPALLLLSPLLARLLGDMQTLPSLLCTVPAIWLLGLCGAYSGWYYGRENTRLPALCEATEQTVRLLLSLGFLMLLAPASLGMQAALPQAAEVLAALCAVTVMYRCSRMPRLRREASPALRRQIFRLCVPTILARLCVTGTRALTAVLLPACLRLSGLSAQAATAQFGMLTGMAMPLMMLPSIFTGALGVVASPAVSARESHPRALRRTMARLLGWAGLAGMLCCAGLMLGADFIGGTVYRQSALAPLVRLMSPLAVIMALRQVMGGMIAGLGLQRKALTGTVLSACVSLCLTAWLAGMPGLRLFGAALASMAGQLVNLVWHALLLWRNTPADTAPSSALIS